MKRRTISYSTEELAWIEARRTMPRRALHSAFQARFERNDISQANLTALCKRKGWLTGRDGRFAKGQTSWNAGRSMPAHPNSRKTQFRRGQEPHNTKYLGHERISKDGYIEISVAETNPYTGCRRRYVQKHRWLWERKNGAVPKGHCLKCLDGNKTNSDPSNWLAIPRALLPRLNGRWNGHSFDAAPPELKPLILAAAQLDYAARSSRRGTTSNA